MHQWVIARVKLLPQNSEVESLGKPFTSSNSLNATKGQENFSVLWHYGRVYTKTCVIDTSVTFLYNICSKMMAYVSLVSIDTCFKCMPSFYYIHCETWHLCQWHKFRCKHGPTFIFLGYNHRAIDPLVVECTFHAPEKRICQTKKCRGLEKKVLNTWLFRCWLHIPFANRENYSNKRMDHGKQTSDGNQHDKPHCCHNPIHSRDIPHYKIT